MHAISCMLVIPYSPIVYIIILALIPGFTSSNTVLYRNITRATVSI